jgi:hypothetical protein
VKEIAKEKLSNKTRQYPSKNPSDVWTVTKRYLRVFYCYEILEI